MGPILVRRVLALTFFALPSAAQNHKLNGPLAQAAYGDIGFPATSADGASLVYIADRDGGGISNLYSTAAGGKEEPVELAPIDTFSWFVLTPDGRSVVFEGNADGNGAPYIAVAPIDGSAPARVLVSSIGHVESFQVTGDSSRFVYLANPPSSFSPLELYSVPTAGGTPSVRLSGPMVAGGGVRGVAFSSDGRLAAYMADQDVDERVELYVVPTDASSATHKLPLPLVAGGDVAFLALTRDGSRILYTADQEEDERFELFSIPSDGSQPPQKLNASLVGGGDVGYSYGGVLHSNAYPSYDGRWVVYTADQETDELFELYCVPADGTRAPVKLSLPTDHEPGFASFSYDSAWVIYVSDPSETETYELFSVPVDGSAPARRISGPMVPGGDAFFPQVSFDSLRVVYEADQDVDEVHELYSAPIDGAAPPVKLSGPLVPGGDLTVNRINLLPGFQAMEGGVMYEADQEIDGFNELYFAPLAGGAAPRKLASGPVALSYPSTAYLDFPPTDFGRVLFLRNTVVYSVGIEPGATPIEIDSPQSDFVVGSVETFTLSRAGDRVVYRAREENDAVAELYSVPTDKPSARVQLFGDLLLDARVESHRLVPDGRRVLFLAAVEPRSQRRRLYSVPVDGSEAARELNRPLGLSDFVMSDAPGRESYSIAPDGETVVFLAFVAERPVLFAAPVDGSELARDLSAALPSTVRLRPSLRISPDGSRVAVLDQSARLYTAALDSLAPARLVSLDGQRVQHDFQFLSAGSGVVYRTSATATVRGELFVVPSDASAAPLRISHEMPNTRDVTAFALASDGTRAVYLTDLFVDEQFELFSVLTDGSASPVPLHAALGVSRDVLEFAIASDSRHVVYRADSLANERFELFGSPIDGSAPPVRLSGNLAVGGDVLGFQLSPDAARVVYLADQEVDGVDALYSNSIPGGRRPVRLSRTLVPGGDVIWFRISEDSSTVAFTAQGAGGTRTLLATSIRGEEKAMELAGPFQLHRGVVEFQLSGDGSVAVYRADQDQYSVELYAARRSVDSKAARH